MAAARTLGYGLVGTATTMLARRITRSAMHDREGSPRVPRRLRSNNSFEVMFFIAAAAGAFLALGDVLQEQRKAAAHS